MTVSLSFVATGTAQTIHETTVYNGTDYPNLIETSYGVADETLTFRTNVTDPDNLASVTITVTDSDGVDVVQDEAMTEQDTITIDGNSGGTYEWNETIGTSPTYGSWSYSITATDQDGNTATDSGSIEIVDPGTLDITLWNTTMVTTDLYTLIDLQANVSCQEGSCGLVNGSLQYGDQGTVPGTPVGTNPGDQPFVAQDAQDAIFSLFSDQLVTQEDWNTGQYDGTSADRNNGDGPLGIGLLNGSNPAAGSLENELLGFWRLDTTSDDVMDYSDTAPELPGTIYGDPDRTAAGPLSTSAYRFDGDTDAVEVGGNDVLNPKEELTVSVWFRIRSFDRSQLVTKGESIGTGSSYGPYSLSIYSETLYYELQWSDSERTFVGEGVSNQTWYHAVGTYDANQSMTLYLDGEVVGSSTDVDTLKQKDRPVRIGAAPQGWYELNGSIADVRIYNRTLSASEVEQLYFRGNDGPFQGSYTSDLINPDTDTISWEQLELDIPTETDNTTINVTFEALDGSGTVIDTKTFTELSDGLQNLSLTDVTDTEQARYIINGTSSNVTTSWEVNETELYYEDATSGQQCTGAPLAAGENCSLGWTVNTTQNGVFSLATFFDGPAWVDSQQTPARTAAIGLGEMTVTKQTLDDPVYYAIKDEPFWMNTTIECSGAQTDSCGTISGSARSGQGTTSPAGLINVTTWADPVIGGGEEYQDKICADEADITVGTPADKTDLADALATADGGDIVFVDPSASIDMGFDQQQDIPEGVTLAGGRGCDESDGATLYTDDLPYEQDIYSDDESCSSNCDWYYHGEEMFRITNDSTRITGFQIRGPHGTNDWFDYNYLEGQGIDVTETTGTLIDNNEIWGFSHSAVNGDGHFTVTQNSIHNQSQDALGYGVAVGTDGDATIEQNRFAYNRHSVTGNGDGTNYTVRQNLFTGEAIGSPIDMHGPGGDVMIVTNNTIEPTDDASEPGQLAGVIIRGNQTTNATIDNNWFYNPDEPQTTPSGDWDNEAIVRSDEDDDYTFDDWGNISFTNNQYGTTEPACSIGADRAGCLGIDVIDDLQITRAGTNPQNCVLDGGESCELAWQINATGAHGAFNTIDMNAASSFSPVLADQDTDDQPIRVVTDTISMNMSLHDDTDNVHPDTTVSVLDSGIVLNKTTLTTGGPELNQTIGADTGITLRWVTETDGASAQVQMNDVSSTTGTTVTPHLIETYQGDLPARTEAIGPVFGAETAAITVSNGTITLPRDGITPNRILHCPTWNRSAMTCDGQWQTELFGTYDAQINATHVTFTVDSFSAYTISDHDTGSGGSVPAPAPDLTIENTSIEVVLEQGTQETISLSFRNNGTGTGTYLATKQGQEKFVEPVRYNTTGDPGETISNSFTVSVSETIATETFNGSVSVNLTETDIVRTIPFRIQVTPRDHQETEDPGEKNQSDPDTLPHSSFNSSVTDLSNETVAVTITNTGPNKSLTVSITYQVLDEDGNNIYERTRHTNVTGEKAIRESLNTTFAPGNYTMIATITAANETIEITRSFQQNSSKTVEPQEKSDRLPLILILIAIVTIGLVGARRNVLFGHDRHTEHSDLPTAQHSEETDPETVSEAEPEQEQETDQRPSSDKIVPGTSYQGEPSETNQEGQFQCYMCGSTFKTREQRRAHVNQEHI